MGRLRTYVLAAGMTAVTLASLGAAVSPPATRAGDRGGVPRGGGGGGAATAPAARGVVEGVLREVEAILRDPKTSRAEKQAKVREIAEATMDFDTLARLAMGANWRDLTDAQHDAFTREFRQHVVNTYGHTIDDYTDEDLTVSGDNEEARGDWTVQTRILGTRNGTRQEIAKVDYRLRPKDGQWKLIDITIDGVSMMANFRSQFQEIMTHGGIDTLLKLLHDKNAAGAGAPGATGK